jgi:hypothetical protein
MQLSLKNQEGYILQTSKHAISLKEWQQLHPALWKQTYIFVKELLLIQLLGRFSPLHCTLT